MKYFSIKSKHDNWEIFFKNTSSKIRLLIKKNKKICTDIYISKKQIFYSFGIISMILIFSVIKKLII